MTNSKPASSLPARSLKGTVQVPGDKSISHRALILSTLAEGVSTIEGLLPSEDVLNTLKAMRQLGAVIACEEHHISVHGVGVGALLEPEDVIDCGNAGTAVRLIMGLVAPYDMICVFTGDASLRKRPMGRVFEPLSRMGAYCVARQGQKLPCAIQGAQWPVPIQYTLPVPSAQVKSAILLAGLSTPGTTSVIEPIPTRDHTERMLKAAGADIVIDMAPDGTRTIHVTGGKPLLPGAYSIPADPSSAAFPLVAALITPDSDVTLTNVMLNPTRTGLFTTLKEMGADLTISNERDLQGETVGDIRARSSALKGVTVPAERAPSMIDEYPALAIAAAFAKGPTRMDGLHELRVKESDRLSAICAGLEANGIAFEAGDDWLEVEGTGGEKVPGGGMVTTHMDHRIAMSFLILGAHANTPVSVDDISKIETSFPGFQDVMAKLGLTIEPCFSA
jgi:3-phosphoshikimate 1-carboxyvinyltransferase